MQLLAQASADEVLAVAATVEAGSEHPLARAVLEYAYSRLGTAPGHRGSLDAELGAALGEEDGWDWEGDQVPLSVRLPSREGKAAPSWQLPAKDSESHAGAPDWDLPACSAAHCAWSWCMSGCRV